MRLLHVGITAREGKWLSKELAQRTVYAEIKPEEGPGNILSFYHNHKPDLVFMQIQQERNELLPVVSAMTKSLVINWTGDVREPLPDWFVKFNAYCVTCFSNMDDVQKIEGAEYLQIGIDPEIFRRHEVTPAAEIVFMANRSMCFPLSTERVQTVDFLRKTYGDRFEVVGGWPGSRRNLMNDQYAESRFYSSCKIAISLSHFNRSRYFSDRLIRAMGSGCFTLSHHYPDIEKDFTVGEHLDTYKDFKELRAKINYYLENKAERKRIAENGYQWVHKKFTTKNMVDDIFKIYEKYKSAYKLV